jgi:hypothetical protein
MMTPVMSQSFAVVMVIVIVDNDKQCLRTTTVVNIVLSAP